MNTKEAKISVKDNPTDEFEAYRICSEKSLLESIEVLKQKASRTPDEDFVLNELKNIYKQRFERKEETK